MIRKWRFLIIFLVGATGFEPATSATPLQRATKLRHAPIFVFEFLPFFKSVCADMAGMERGIY